MPSHPDTQRPRGQRRGRQLRPSLLPLEQRLVPATTFPGITGIAYDTSGDVFVSYDSTTFFSGQQQSVAEINSSGFPDEQRRIRHNRHAVRVSRHVDRGRGIGLTSQHQWARERHS